jgi:hypothetical protein
LNRDQPTTDHEQQTTTKQHMSKTNFEKLEVRTLKPVVEELAPRLNAYLKSIGRFPEDVE